MVSREALLIVIISEIGSSVNHYNETSAILELFHNYPLQKSATRSTVHLDITDVLELVKREDIEAGAWLNIVGYIQPSTDPSTRNGPKGVRTVKAIMLWSAGSINLAEYESALTERQET